MKRPEGFDPNAGPGVPVGKPAHPSRIPLRTPELKPKDPVIRSAVRNGGREALRRAFKERRRFERAEVRRFTRRARHRRLVVATLAGLVSTMIGLVAVAVFSPLLALRAVDVDGAARIDPAEIAAAVDTQLGVPLALLDFDDITRELSAFPLIRSYVAEIVPPDTLRIHIVERQPVGSVAVGSTYELVDPAGIVLEQSTARVAGVALIETGTQDDSRAAFDSAVRVLLSLPPDLLARVDRISATTSDDVSMTLVGVGQRVTWGSAADSGKKARLLTALIGLTDPGAVGEFDVSATGNVAFRPG